MKNKRSKGPTPSFWKGKCVFITGHTGFKGSWLALWLSELGAAVTGFSLSCDEGVLRKQKGFSPKIQSIYGDIRDYDSIKNAIRKAAPEYVFHLAAQPLVRASYREPMATYATNVMGTAHILESIRTVGTVRSAVIITTDKCYEDQKWPWGYRENDRLGGYDPYSSSKACTELVSASYRSSFFSEPGSPAIATARAGNVIGGGDWAEDRLIPDIVRALTSGQAVHIRRPDAVRPWQHVLDPLAGYLLLAERMAEDRTFGEAWNFGPDETEGHTVRWMTETFAKVWGDTGQWTYDEGSHPHETALLRLDCSKARQLLGWRPLLETQEAVAWTAAWHRRHNRGENPLSLCLEQIDTYMNRLERS